jgi:predicted Zn-dependent protease
MTSRREKIEAMLVDQPNDVFLRYGLAMELDKEGEHQRSLSILDGLMQETPAYVPAFFMAGQQLVRIDRIEDAKPILEQGIVAAKQQGNSHAAGEMMGFLDSL